MAEEHVCCGKDWGSWQALAAHKKGHGEKQVCPICGVSRRRMQQHMDRFHTEEPEVGDEIFWETAEHWQEFEATKAENRQLKQLLDTKDAEIRRLDGLRKRYLANWQKAKRDLKR